MDGFVDDRDFKLIEQDRYTFFVLQRILKLDCKVTLSDHERLIICYSDAPHPVWIWTPDDASEGELARAYDKVNEVLPFDGGYIYNLKYELADYILKRTAEDENNYDIKLNMFAYDCPVGIEPRDKADGDIHKCTDEDVDEIVDIMELFHNETGVDISDRDNYRKRAIDAVNYGRMYLWKNSEGRFTAGCNYQPSGELASINLVYTREEDRRKHYADNLVYRVTEIARSAGFLPILYTNADYVASNACYEKIGYKRQGKLCTIEIR